MAQTLSRVQGRVELHHGNYTIAPDIEATWFIDPPYQIDGQYYAHNQKHLDFSKLSSWCRLRRGQVIITESQGANWMDFRHHRTNKTIANTHSTEMVWYSHPDPDLFSEIEVG